MPHIKNLFGRFHHSVAQQISGKFPHRRSDRTWGNPCLEGFKRDSGIDEIKTYISRRKNTVKQYIDTWPN